MVVAAAVKLIIWNIGKDSGYDPDNITSEFETEALDYIQPLDPELLKSGGRMMALLPLSLWATILSRMKEEKTGWRN